MKKDYAQELNDVRILTYLASHWNLLMACLIVCILKNTIAIHYRVYLLAKEDSD